MSIQPKPFEWEIVKEEIVTISHTPEDITTELVFNHNLSYTPVIFAYANYDSGTKFRPLPVVLVDGTGSDEGLCYELLIISSNDTSVTIELVTPDISDSRFDDSFDIDIKLFYFRFKANEI